MTDFEQNARELFHAELLTNKDVRLGDKLNPKLGLALRRLVVNWLVEAKPRLVHSGSPEGILCYRVFSWFVKATACRLPAQRVP